MKKIASTTTKERSNQDEDKNARIQIIKSKIFNVSSKTLARYQANIFLRGLKFTPVSKRNNIELKSNIQNYNHKL